MVQFNELIERKEKVSVIGLGYVGFPLLIELAEKYDVIGYDLNESKINNYKSGFDVTNEIGNERTNATKARFTCNEKELAKCKFHIVAVPTPINSDKTPDLTPIMEASKTIARNLSVDSIIVFESTVYPGTTEEICIPVLEEYSGLTFGKDFEVGYSPERINPGDKVNTLTNIVKVVSGSSKKTLNTIYNVYDAIITAGVHKAPTIKVAEAAKVIENAQRDINIAFMNELAMVFDKMGIDTNDVLKAAKTKWNFLNFKPGLVGGHCIGVDPYYFTYKAEQLGYHSQIVLAGRKINDEMGKYIATNIIKQLIHSGQKVKGAKVVILGITFKENVSDIRNTKISNVIDELRDFGVNIVVHDPVANEKEVKEQLNINLSCKEDICDVNALVLAVPHNQFKDNFFVNWLDEIFINEKVLIDIKGVIDKTVINIDDYYYWSL